MRAEELMLGFSTFFATKCCSLWLFTKLANGSQHWRTIDCNFMQKTSYILKIENPCPQDWDLMWKNECGKFCSRCSKTVIDFSDLTDEEVYKIINRTTEKICGHITVNQLNRAISHRASNKNIPLLKLVAGLLFIGFPKASTTFGRQIGSNIEGFQMVNTERTLTKPKKNPTDPSYNTIRGKIVDSGTKEILSGAVVVIKRTNIGVVTDEKGDFSLTIPDRLLTEKIVFVVSCVGYSSKEFSISKDSLNMPINFAIPQTEQTLDGEIIIVKKKKWWQFWK